MYRHWNRSGIESAWLDENGSIIGSDEAAKPAGVETAADYLLWLKRNDIRAYSSFTAAGAGMLPPWQHRHKAIEVQSLLAGEVVPDCCGMPARLVRDGWLCRISAEMLVEDGSSGIFRCLCA